MILVILEVRTVGAGINDGRVHCVGRPAADFLKSFGPMVRKQIPSGGM